MLVAQGRNLLHQRTDKNEESFDHTNIENNHDSNKNEFVDQTLKQPNIRTDESYDVIYHIDLKTDQRNVSENIAIENEPSRSSNGTEAKNDDTTNEKQYIPQTKNEKSINDRGNFKSKNNGYKDFDHRAEYEKTSNGVNFVKLDLISTQQKSNKSKSNKTWEKIKNSLFNKNKTEEKLRIQDNERKENHLQSISKHRGLQ